MENTESQRRFWSDEAERAVLGGILINNDVIEDVVAMLDAQDFYKDAHRKIFRSMLQLHKSNQAIDYLTLEDQLKKHEQYEEVGGASYITDLSDKTPSSANVIYYATMVKEKADIRQDVEFAHRTLHELNTGQISHQQYRILWSEHMEATHPICISRRNIVCVPRPELTEMDIPKREPILEPWLREKDLAMVYGFRGAGKSWVSFGIAVAASSGGQFLNWKANRSHNVLLVDGEMPLELVQSRLSTTERAIHATATGKLRIITPDIQQAFLPNLAEREGQRLLDEHLADTELVVFDNLSTLFRGVTENEAEGWQAIQDWLLLLRHRGTAVVLVHHAGKSGQQRGTSRREDVLDTVISLKRPPNYHPSEGAKFEVHYEKARSAYGSSLTPVIAQMSENGNGPQWTYTTLEVAEQDTVIEMAREGYQQAEIARETGRHKSQISRWIKKAKEEGRIK